MVTRRPGGGGTRTVEVQVRRLDFTSDEEWLITRIGEREIRVQHGVDQCSPRAWFRVVETDTEIRLRYYRAPSRNSTCSLVLFSHWDRERVLKLRAPVAGRRVVAELGVVSNAFLDESCPWFGASITALIDDAPASERRRLALLATSNSSQEYAWQRLITAALMIDDSGRRARIGRGIRRDMRRLAYPSECDRPIVMPAVASSDPTAYVVGGKHDDADLVGLDAAGAVTWARHLDGATVAVDVCPGGTHAMVVERTPDTSWPTEARMRVRFVDVATGEIGATQSVRRLIGDAIDGIDVGASAWCTSPTSGWLEMQGLDPFSYGWKTFVDEVWAGGTRRVPLPADIESGVLGDGVLYTQAESATGSDGRRLPSTLIRLDLRTGLRVTGAVIPGAAKYLSPDGRVLVTDHGPIRSWNVTSGIRMLHSVADLNPTVISRDSGAWSTDGSFVYMTTDLESMPQVGRAWRFDPQSGAVAQLDVRSEGQMDLLAVRGETLLAMDDHPLPPMIGGLMRWDAAADRWVSFAPALSRGDVTSLDVIAVSPTVG